MYDFIRQENNKLCVDFLIYVFKKTLNILCSYMNEVSSQIYHVCDIVGSRILTLQDHLNSLACDDPRRETLIAVLVEFDDLKRELADFFGAE